MLDDRLLIEIAAFDAGDEFVLIAADDEGHRGVAVMPAQQGLVARLVQHTNAQVRQPVVSANRRWVDRPRQGGDDWVVYSAVETALASLAAESAGLSMRQWLGGPLRQPAAAVDPARLAGSGRTVGDASFDEIAAWIPTARVAWIRVDPRRWAVPAIVRLDALCRVLQIGLAIEAPSGSLAGALANDLIATLPMATLGRVHEVRPLPADLDSPFFAITHPLR